MAPIKKSTSIRLSDEALALIAELARKLGSNRTGVIEMAVRKLAIAEGVMRAPTKEFPAKPKAK